MDEISFVYDEEADVMYISFGTPVPCISEERYPNVLYRFNIKTKQLNGITILGFLEREIKF